MQIRQVHSGRKVTVQGNRSRAPYLSILLFLATSLVALLPTTDAHACLSREARTRQLYSGIVPELRVLLSTRHTAVNRPWQGFTGTTSEPAWQVLVLWQPARLFSPWIASPRC